MKTTSNHRNSISMQMIASAIFASVLVSAAIASPNASAASKTVQMVAFTPTWAKHKQGNANVSYFNDTTSVRPPETLNDQVFDASTSKGLRTEYENRVAQDQYRVNAGLTESYEEKGRFEAMKAFAKHAMRSIYKVRLKEQTKKMRHLADDAPMVVREPVAAMVLAAALYTGKSMNFKVAEGLRVNSRASVKNKDAALSMNLFDTGLSTGVAYNRENNVTAQVAQQLSSEISAVVSSAEKGSASMVYSLSF